MSDLLLGVAHYTQIKKWDARKCFGYVVIDGCKVILKGTSFQPSIMAKRNLSGRYVRYNPEKVVTTLVHRGSVSVEQPFLRKCRLMEKGFNPQLQD